MHNETFSCFTFVTTNGPISEFVYKDTFGKQYDHDPSLCAQDRRENLLCATRRALSLALCDENIRIGFERAGIRPFNNRKLDRSPYVHQVIDYGPEAPEGRRRDPPPAFVNPLTINNWTTKFSANEN